MARPHGRTFSRGASRAALPSSTSQVPHWLRQPSSSEQFKINGKPAQDDKPGALALMNKLKGTFASQQDEEEVYEHIWGNPTIPAGYTYLGQFIAHDMSHARTPFIIAGANTPPRSNARTGSLRLDTLYGGGPTVDPLAYAVEPAGDTYRNQLRLRAVDPVPGNPPLSFARDIYRVSDCPVTVACPIPRQFRDVLIADPRSDDNSLIAQLTTVFSLAHNALIGLLRTFTWRGGVATSAEIEHARYLCARAILETIYRAIVVEDYLAKICEPNVLDWLKVNGPLSAPGSDVSAEFSHAAFRFGHAMTRPRYRINQTFNTHDLSAVLQRTSHSQPWNGHLGPDWIVDWQLFFRFPGYATPAPSRRLSATYAADLDIAIDDSNCRWRMPLRDLMRTVDFGMWSVPSLVENIRAAAPKFADALASTGSGQRLLDSTSRVSMIKDWLDHHPNGAELSAAERAALADDPPLLLFILREADAVMGGTQLGALGSAIVADTLLTEVRDAREDGFAKTGTDGIPLIVAECFDTTATSEESATLRKIVAIDSAPALIAWIAESRTA